MTPAVSVVIPCFNLGAYLDEAVRSVLDQSYDDFEILIVDDGSDDEVTRLMLATYERPRMSVIRIENSGVANARNVGLEASRGRYVSFLDPDDLLEPRFLERTIGALEKDRSLAFASCWLTAFGDRQFEWRPESCEFPALLAEDTVCTAAPVRRDVLDAIGGFDSAPALDGYEDWDLAVTIVGAGYPGVIVPESLFRYRIRSGSKSSSRTRPENHARVFEHMLDKHADAYGEHTDGVLEAIARRTDEVEAQLDGDPPPRPRVDREDWRAAILALENHRRGLEEQLEAASGSGPEEEKSAPPVEWGSLRRLEPVSRVWGIDRGQPIDRFYIERFLETEADAIKGDVLEVKDPAYAKRFGARARSVAAVDVASQNPDATFVADLAGAHSLPAERFDCFVLTQTIHIVYDVAEVVRNAHRTLAPGGVVLATLPCVSRIDYESGIEGDFWRFTSASAARLFETEFGVGNVRVESFGNVLACTAFLQGLAVCDLDPAELERNDPYFPLLLAVHAQKPAPNGLPPPRRRAVEGHLDEATCLAVSGWAWDPDAPEQRLRVALAVGEDQLGHAWCDEPREDLAATGKGGGRVAFHYEPGAEIHREPPAEVSATVDGAHLVGSPRKVRCVCGRAGVEYSGSGAGLLGADLDTPKAGVRLAPPEIELVGWAVGEDGPVESVELLHRGTRFARVPVGRERPDLADAFPGITWATRAGFATRLNLSGTGGELELEVRAALADGQTTRVARITAHVADPLSAPLIAVLDGPPPENGRRLSLASQRSPASQVFVRGSGELTGHPGFRPMGGWHRLLGSPEGAMVWLCSGHEELTPEFLDAATERLAANPSAAFVSAVATAGKGPRSDLASALGGAALGCAVVFRASSMRLVGGIDEAATTAVAATWDLVVRFAEAGHDWVELDGVTTDGAVTLVEQADEETVRWLYRKHARLYRDRLDDVLLEREAEIGRTLRANHLAERALESEIRPRARARRRERDRVAAKLRAHRRPADGFWGDLRRFQPFSPVWGGERGLGVDRHYIERFLEAHAGDIRGAVLSCPDAVYAERFGGERVERCDVFDPDPTNPAANLDADEADADGVGADGVPSGSYDCVILAHVLQHTFEVVAAVAEFRRVLKPGGVLLATVPCLARIDAGYGLDRDHWRFTPVGLREIVEPEFAGGEVKVAGYGNRLARLGFLAGLAVEELEGPEPAQEGGDAPMIVTCRAVAQIS